MRFAFTAFCLLLGACRLNSSGENRNLKQVPTGVTVAYYSGDVPQDWHRYAYTYDGAGQLTSELHSKSDGKTFEPAARLELAYDDRGRLILAQNFNLQENSQEPNLKSSYAYRDDGTATVTISVRSGTVWEESGISEWSFDTRGRLLRVTSRIRPHPEDELKPRMRWTYSYDDQGRVLSELAEQFADASNAGDSWQFDQRSTYLYDADRLLRVDRSLSAGIVTNRMNYLYERDQFMGTLSERIDGSGWAPTDKVTLLHRDTGVTLTSWSYRDGTWVPEVKRAVELKAGRRGPLGEDLLWPEPIVGGDVSRGYGMAPWNRYAQ